MRMTVKIKMPTDATEREFHFEEAKAEEFAKRVRRDGGEARIVPLQISGALLAQLKACGVDVSSIH
ncbi:MAG: hypothetical protein HOO99_03245 [Hyphomicrobiaceae bacterium]|nr:hypothetical protein [Hyphomicrobiaceae bacterium]